MSTPSPLALLVLVSSPHTAQISARDDLHALHDAVADLEYAAEFVTCVGEANAVQRVLVRHDRPRFRILHFIGHGSPADDDVDSGAGAGALTGGAPGSQARLAFEGELGERRMLDGAALAPVLAPTGALEFELAVLSACHSEAVGEALIALGVRHVVAIEADAAVYEIAAVRFYAHFYRALFTGADVTHAFAAGRSAVLTDARLGAAAAVEAAKFRLLPADGDHTATFAAARADAPVRVHALPALTTTHFCPPAVGFIGRSAEKLAILRELDAHRAVLIKGVSGVGKSELAREIGRWLVERSRVAASCAWFAPLVGAHSDAEIRIAVALAMGVNPESMPTDAGAANDWLAAQLPRRSLLVLDEAENAIEHGGRAVRDLLERLVQAPNRPLIIVTAQKDVGSRALPVCEVRRMEMDAAVRLFAACARLEPGGLVRLQHAELAEALDFMDRLPRAIELLAAVWRDRRDPDLTGLLAEMRRHRDRILRDPKYPDEVKSVTLGVQLGYDRLQQRSLDAAALFADLSLFPGGLNAAGATAIYGAGGPALLRLIEDQSLLERTADDLFYLPTPFRYFAERQVAGGGAAAQARLGQPALAYYAGWAPTLDDGLVGGGAAMGAIIARFLTELPSIECGRRGA